MRAYFATTYKELHAGSSSLSNSTEHAVSRKDLKQCPRCKKKKAVILEEDVPISQGGILIHVKKVYCIHCKETYGIPV